jgi:predicted lipase
MFDTEVKKHLKEGGNLLCVGHSLGSANGTIAAINYGSSNPGQVYFVGYGCPRVGNKAFADTFNKCVKLRIRVKNCSDPIAAILPPVCDYTHVGYELHLGPRDTLPEIPVLLDLGDHSITEYEKNLARSDRVEATIPLVSRNWYLSVVDAFRWSIGTTRT